MTRGPLIDAAKALFAASMTFAAAQSRLAKVRTVDDGTGAEDCDRQRAPGAAGEGPFGASVRGHQFGPHQFGEPYVSQASPNSGDVAVAETAFHIAQRALHRAASTYAAVRADVEREHTGIVVGEPEAHGPRRGS